jgi:hypothetical protein
MSGLYSVVFCFFGAGLFKSPTFPTVLQFVYLSFLFPCNSCNYLFCDTNAYVGAAAIILS